MNVFIFILSLRCAFVKRSAWWHTSHMWATHQIKALLEELERADPERRVFGAEAHHYRLNAPCPEATVAEFERTNGITLPADYRCFVTQVGDGGAGPYYGQYPLLHSTQESDFGSPFLLTERSEMTNQEVSGGLYLSHQGCGIGTWLIVNGLSYGLLWEGCDDISPTGLSFWQWYERWLLHLRDYALPVLANEQKIKGLRVGMPLAEVARRCPTSERCRFPGYGKDEAYRVSFEGLATQFAVSKNDNIVRIIAHSI